MRYRSRLNSALNTRISFDWRLNRLRSYQNFWTLAFFRWSIKTTLSSESASRSFVSATLWCGDCVVMVTASTEPISFKSSSTLSRQQGLNLPLSSAKHMMIFYRQLRRARESLLPLDMMRSQSRTSMISSSLKPKSYLKSSRQRRKSI